MNAALKALGFGPQDRVVILHADDIGMCQATLPAIADLYDFGLLSSAAVMVPCPWFSAAAAFCRAHAGIDMGVHLTVNAEWEAYRWGPISTRDESSGLLDATGYFHASPPATWQQADPAAAAAEMRAQVARALAAGVDATHVDAHMGTVMRAPYVAPYLEVARENELPAFFLGPDAAGIPDELRAGSGVLAAKLVADGMPVFDSLAMLPLDDPANHVGVAKNMIDQLPPGLSMLLMHPAQDTPELRAMTPDWPCRVANYEALLSTELRDYVRQSGVQVIGYRPLRDLLRMRGA